ncbi:hypothetical protein PG984_016199 [Apiospora sp. TS-2023a]
MEATLHAFVENNTRAVNTRNPSLLSAVLADDCVRHYRPRSFVRRHAAFLRPRLTNAEYEAQMAVELQGVAGLRQTITRVVVDAPARRAVVWVEATVTAAAAAADTAATGDGGGDGGEEEDKDKTPVEVVFDLDFTADGTRVSQILEFVDTLESTRVLEHMLAKAKEAA